MNLGLTSLARLSDATLAAVRVLTGAVLVQPTWGSMPGSSRIAGMVGSLGRLDLPPAAVLPPLSDTVQFLCGVLLIAGLLTRWAGLLLVAIIAVAFVRSGLGEPLGSGWPRLMLLLLGLHFACTGPGRYALDGLFAGRGKRR